MHLAKQHEALQRAPLSQLLPYDSNAEVAGYLAEQRVRPPVLAQDLYATLSA